MMAMRYGTIPVVHEVGGLKDTVQPYNQFDNTGTGFGFSDFNGYWFTQTVLKAVNLYKDEPEKFAQLQQRAMSTDFSWENACSQYENLYDAIRVD